MNRRRFLAGAAAGGAGLLILRNSASAWSYQANEKLNIALMGVGARGKHFLARHSRASARTSWPCATSTSSRLDEAGQGSSRGPAIPRFSQDVRRDGAPDRRRGGGHARALARRDRHGGHEAAASTSTWRSPLTHNVGEARAMRDLARRQKVATQMGNQGMATDSFRRTLELIQDGAIGEIREAHVLFESGGTGPAGASPGAAGARRRLDWDLWIGPAADAPLSSGLSATATFPGRAEWLR